MKHILKEKDGLNKPVIIKMGVAKKYSFHKYILLFIVFVLIIIVQVQTSFASFNNEWIGEKTIKSNFKYLPIGNTSINQDQLDNKFEVSGRVLDVAKRPISLARVTLIKSSTNKVIKIAITDTVGNYKLLTDESGDFFVKYSAVGMDSLIVSLSLNKKTLIKMPDIQLNPISHQLNEVIIDYKKPVIELSNDKIIFNVNNLINTIGDNALEVLKQAPGVDVSINNTISLKGDQGVQIRINGRSTYLNGGDLANILKAIPAADIDQIEIISNPSAKFDAAGTAGIINIKLKKNKSLGFNGSLSLNGLQGFTSKFDGSVQGNYRLEKINVYGNYNYSDGVYRSTTSALRRQIINNNSTVSIQRTNDFDGNKSHSYRTGIDYFVSKKSTLGFLFSGSNNRNDDLIIGSTVITNGINQIDSILNATNNRLIKRVNYNTNINYQYTDTLGRSLDANFNYIFLNRKETSLQPNTYTNAAGTLLDDPIIYLINAPTKINIMVANIDYEQKLFQGNVGIGAKYSYVDSENDFNSYNVINGENVINSTYTNFFNYSEKINSGYVNYGRNIKSWSLQIGLRAEQTISDGQLTTYTGQNNERVTRNYLNLFPNFSISFKKDEKNKFNLIYSRRIERPNYQNLNPFLIRMDELTAFQGNPFLKPQFSNNIELNFSHLQYIIATIGYKQTNNIVSPITDSTQNNHIIESYQNIGKRRSITFSISSSLNINKWWSISLNTNLFHQQYDGQLDRGTVSNAQFTFMTNGRSSFKLSKSVSTEVSVFYRTPEVNGIYRNSSVGQVDWGLKKTLFNERGTIRISYSDIFNMLKLTSYSNYSGLNIIGTQKPESQIFKIGFNYRFGNKLVKSARSRVKGSEDESGRL